ncbi:MAG TPA: hypothetical protein VF885_16910 [Arthrobacter sp.]
MAQLTELDVECLEYQEGFLSGLMLCAAGQPEQLNRYASRYATILALLGRVKEHEYYAAIADASAPRIGRAAAEAWAKNNPRARLLTGHESRIRWEQAYTESLFMDADASLRRVKDDTAAFRATIARHFKKDGSRR